MPITPKSTREIVNEALIAFDLEFSEIVNEFKYRLELVISQKGFDSDAYRLLEELRQIKFERKDLGKQLSDRQDADRLNGRLKNVRYRLDKLFNVNQQKES